LNIPAIIPAPGPAVMQSLQYADERPACAAWPGYNTRMTNLPPLGDLTPAEFFRDYWQKKPLLIRQAIAGFAPPLNPEALFALAAQEEVEARLICHFDQQWQMQDGPFAALPARSQSGWTLLVQGVNLHDRAADALLRRFRFVPDARLDDLMISFATDGGGVGPHFDSYDVFLLQAHGRRRWQIGSQQDLSLKPDMPLKILARFEPEQEFILEPGDMLYLPPHYAHDGIALGDCMTYSIGFRAPSYQELGQGFLEFMGDSIDLPGRYADPDLKPGKAPAEISKRMLTDIAAELRKVRFTDDDIAIFVGQYLTEPKHTTYFTAPQQTLTPPRFASTAGKKGLRLALKTQMLYRGPHVFINGMSFEVEPQDRALLARLANDRSLPGELVGAARADVAEALYTWYQDGWLEITI